MPELDPSPSPDFKTFEHEGWERVAFPYRDSFSSLTAQTIEPLLDATGVRSGARLLDVACGPGDGAAAAAKRGARATGIDFAKSMVLQASRLHPLVEFRIGDAEALPFDPGRFDAVMINFGILHFADPDRAIAEAHRVLRSGGSLAFTAWTPPEKSAGFAIVHKAIETHGRMDVPLPEGPPFFRFADPIESRRALEAAGFGSVEVRELPLVWRLAAPEDLFDAFWEGGVRTRGLLRAQSPGALAAIREAIGAEAAQHAREGGVELAMPAVLTSGVKA
jgi:ubiquinone/menaquinone biosynthesis C-methylase UbiE